MSESEKKPMVIWQDKRQRVVWNGKSILSETAYSDAMGVIFWSPAHHDSDARRILENAMAAYAERMGPVPPEGTAPRGRTRTGEDVV